MKLVMDMLMEIELDEYACEQYDMDIYACYDMMDAYFMMQGIQIMGKGFYSGNRLKDKGFKAFALSLCTFPKIDRFIECTTKWNWYSNDCVKDYLYILKWNENAHI